MFLEKCLTINELKDAFFSLKINKISGVDEISFNVIVFNLSLQTRIFLDHLMIEKVTPAFKTVDLVEISNYRPISILPCFSKILESSYTTTFIAT